MNPDHETRLRATLHEQAARAVPPSADLWPVIRARVAGDTALARPAFAWGRMVVATLLLVAVTGAALWLAGLGPRSGGGAGDPYPLLAPGAVLTETLGSYTLLLYPAYRTDDPQFYADGNQIILVYKVRDAAGHFVPAEQVEFSGAAPFPAPELRDEGGTGYPYLGQVPGPAAADGEGVLLFDTSRLAPVPPALNLRLQLAIYQITGGANGRPADRPPQTPITVPFRLTFDTQRRVAAVGKAATHDTMTITLDWVSITHRTTRVFYRLTGTDGTPVHPWLVSVHLADGQGWDIPLTITSYEGGAPNSGCDAQGYCYGTYTGPGPVGGLAGAWTFTVELAAYRPDPAQPPFAPWVITFPMPAISDPAPVPPTYPPTEPLGATATDRCHRHPAAGRNSAASPTPTLPPPLPRLAPCPPPGPPPTAQVPLVAGAIAADFSAQTLDGQTMRLGDYRGQQAVWLVFQASWCAPCQDQQGAMEQLYHDYQGRGVAMLTVDVIEFAGDNTRRRPAATQLAPPARHRRQDQPELPYQRPAHQPLH